MRSAEVPGFLPSTHAFHFDNSWPYEPDLTLPSAFGPIGIGDASNGLCGGMTYSVRDMWESSAPVPDMATHPAAGTPLYGYIVRRLFDSFDIPSGVMAYWSWQLPTRNQFKDMVTTEWPKIKADIDAGRLSPLGLIRVRSFSPFDMGKNHQVLARSYSIDDANHVVVGLYDPNHHDDDRVALSFSIGNPDGPSDVRYSAGNVAATPDEVTFGAFVTNYHHVNPAFAAELQGNWRWCRKCQGLFFAGNYPSVCPAGGEHDGTASEDYVLTQNADAAAGQQGWRWCHKCQGLFFADNPSSMCPAGAGHETVASGHYSLLQSAPLIEGQDSWRWCRKCQGLFYAGNPGSICPAHGAHDMSGSDDYVLPTGWL